MPQVKIALPETWSFATEIPVRITDVNYGGHAGNDAIVGILHEARMRWLKQFGMTELIAPPVGLIMVNLEVRFKAEAMYGDLLSVSLAPADVSGRGFDLIYRASAGDREVARARTGFVFFDYDAKVMACAPAEFLDRIRVS